MVDSGSTHEFNDKILTNSLNCFVYSVKKILVLVANWGSIDCRGKFLKIKFIMGDYNISISVYSIPIGGVYVLLGIHWLETLGTVSTSYNFIHEN